MLNFADKCAKEGGTSAKEQVSSAFGLHFLCGKLRKTMKEKKERYIELLRSTGRQGIEEVINYLEKSGFFTAPASTKHHLSFEGGLMEHSMNVYDMAMALRGPIVGMKTGVGERLPEDGISSPPCFMTSARPTSTRKHRNGTRTTRANGNSMTLTRLIILACLSATERNR